MCEGRRPERIPVHLVPRALSLCAGLLALASCGAPRADEEIVESQAALHGDRLTNPLVVIPNGTTPNSIPPDTNGDIGRDHFVQMVNPDLFQVWNKRGQSLTSPHTITDFWPDGDPCRVQGSDVIVLYDHLADRWLLSHIGSGNFMCIAISVTPDPTVADASGWHAYSFDTSGFPRDPSIPDYPKLAVWPDAYYMSSFGNDASHHDANIVYALDRVRMIAGACNPTSACLKRIAFDAHPDNNEGPRPFPADLDGAPPAPGTPGFFLRTVDVPDGHRIEVYAASVNWNAGTFSFDLVASLTPAPFRSLSGNRNGGGGDACVPQPHSTVDLACGTRDQAIMRYRTFGTYSSIAFLTLVDARDTVTTFQPQQEVVGIRWYEIRNQSGVWTIHQEGTFAPQPNTTDESALIHRWMANANMDREGNMALGYSVSNASNTPGREIFPSIWYTGRNGDDPLGTMSTNEHVGVAGTFSQTGDGKSARWGDYSSMSMDPVDNCTFWYTNHLALPQVGGYRTPIVSFKFANCQPSARQTCVFGSQRVDLRDRAHLSASVGAIGSLELGSVTSVTGDVFVSGNVLLRGSTINGNLTYSGTLTPQNGSKVTGTTTRAVVTLTPPPTRTIVGGSGDQAVENGQTVTLSPGTFGNMTFRARARVTMDSGTYTFKSLNIEPDVIVTANGPVIVNVQGQFQLGDRSRVDAPLSVAFNVQSNAVDLRIGTDATFNGSITAPNASITVSSRTTVNGCVAGKRVLVDTDSRVIEP